MSRIALNTALAIPRRHAQQLRPHDATAGQARLGQAVNSGLAASQPRLWRVSLLTGLAYVNIGKLGLLLAIPPGYASLSEPRDALQGLALGLPLVSSLGAALQAAWGAQLLRRWLRGPLVLG